MVFVYLSRITVYPIKSFDGINVEETQVLPNGALENDRRFALIDTDDRFVNGKRTPAIHRIRATYDLIAMTVRLHDTAHDRSAEFSLTDNQSDLSCWLSDAVGIPCSVVENSAGGFPDDTDSPGPTVLGSGSIEKVASWFPGLTSDETWRRFRANLLIGGVPPFWEDHYVGSTTGEFPYRIKIDDAEWLGANVCQRCPVPSRAADTGEVTAMFQKTFARRREASLPDWSPRERFDHFYRLAINTRLSPNSKTGTIRVGAPVALTFGESLL